MPIIPDPTPSTAFGSDTTELEVNRLNTKAFIDANPMTVALIPRVRTKSHTGAEELTDQSARADQVVRLISMTFTQRPTVTVDGVERIADFTLLLEWDAQIERRDYFIVGPVRYEVIELVPYNGYEIRALVDSHG